MSKIFQATAKLNIPASDYVASAEKAAPMFAGLPGLRWKLWLLNEAEEEVQGVYLFESEDALNDFLSGPIPVELQNAPFLRDVVLRVFDVIDHATAITRGPVDIIQLPTPK